MTEAEREALELLNEERARTGLAPVSFEFSRNTVTLLALLRVIEERNALRADMAEIDRVAEAFGAFARAHTDADRLDMIAALAAKHRAEPDPLVEAARSAIEPIWQHGTPSRDDVIAAVAKLLAARKEQPNG